MIVPFMQILGLVYYIAVIYVEKKQFIYLITFSNLLSNFLKPLIDV